MRKAWLIAALGVTAIAGCGSDGSSRESSDAPLSRERYVALERLYRATLPVDRLSANDDRAQLHQVTEGVTRTCARTDRGDPLLAAMIDSCERSMRALVAWSSGDCSTDEECADFMRDGAQVVDRMVVAARKSYPVIRREVPDGGCRDVLMSQDGVDAIARMGDAARKAASVLSAGDTEQLDAAMADFEKAAAAQEASGSARRQLKRFEAACGPRSG